MNDQVADGTQPPQSGHHQVRLSPRTDHTHDIAHAVARDLPRDLARAVAREIASPGGQGVGAEGCGQAGAPRRDGGAVEQRQELAVLAVVQADDPAQRRAGRRELGVDLHRVRVDPGQQTGDQRGGRTGER